MATTARECAAAVQSVSVQGPAGVSEIRLAHGCGNSLLVFFEGDQITDDDTRDVLGRQRWSPEAHLESLRTRSSASRLLLVMPTSLAQGGQACYGNFLAAMTASGEPMGFRAQGYPAASHLAAVLAACGGDPDGALAAGSADTAPPAAGVTLVGFSKGAVVLNQLLVEIASGEEAREAAGGWPTAACANRLDAAGHDPSQPGGPTAAAAAAAAAAQPAPEAVPRRPLTRDAAPEAASVIVGQLLDNVQAVHFLDAGLNCRGVHLTDPAAVQLLGRRNRRRPLAVHLHGTPRQWGDRRRPWIAQERDRFLALLQDAGIPVQVHSYFDGQPPSLRQHFDIISNMRAVGEGC